MTNESTLEMIKVQHWKLYATHYNHDDNSLGIGLELKKCNFNTAIMKEWVYLYQGKFSIGLKDQVMMIRFLTWNNNGWVQKCVSCWKHGLLCVKHWTCTIKCYWKNNCKCLDIICSMKSFITRICIMNIFMYKELGTDDEDHNSKKIDGCIE